MNKFDEFVDKYKNQIAEVSLKVIDSDSGTHRNKTRLHLRFIFHPYAAFGEIDFDVMHSAADEATALLVNRATEFLNKIKV